MEELRSTEILDREILEDARRKAEKILKTSEAECRAIYDDVSLRIEKSREEKSHEYKQKAESYRNDSASAIPLEKQRRIVSFVDTSVSQALTDWFTSIGPDRRLALYTDMMKKYRTVFKPSSMTVQYIGYGEAAVRKALTSVFDDSVSFSLSELTPAEASKSGYSDGLYLESDNRSVLCRVTKEELFEDLMSEKRQELALALMGGRLPE